MNIKTTLLAAACALALSACGDKPAPAGETATPPAEVSAVAPAEATPPAASEAAAPTASAAPQADAAASGCATEIEGNDAMQFNMKSITVPATCSEYTITLKHVGKMPVAAMGHNVVITEADDMQKVLADGMAAGAAKDYVKPDDDVIAHTKMIGGGETTSVTFSTAKLKDGGPFKFFCSFPGHAALMNGTIQVQ